PTYVRISNISSGGSAFLGTAYAPFDQDGQVRKSMTMSLPEERLADRKNLLASLDDMNRRVDTSGAIDGMKKLEQQAFNPVFGTPASAFDIKRENSKTIERYGKGLGEQLLAARRLCEAGCGFVTVSYGGWDMHGNIARSIAQKAPALDQAVSALVEDMHQRG